MGLRLMPWQRMVADVGGELVPYEGDIAEYRGLLMPAYREVVFTVPRQNGKTVLVLSWEVQRAIGWEHLGPQRVAYSAQTGKDARDKLLDDQFPVLERNAKALGIQLPLKRGRGDEGVVWLNGSLLKLLASTEESGHGKTLDLGIKDEFFADEDDRRDQALKPAMLTKPLAQVVTCSTMGTDKSVPLNRLVERGRRAVERGLSRGTAYFEWSAPDDADPDDPATWWSCMPALGYSIDENVVAHERATNEENEFRRAYLNQQTKADDRVIPATLWNAVCDDKAEPVTFRAFAVDVTPERTAGSIAGAGDGVVVLARRQLGVGWVVGEATVLQSRHPDVVFAVDESGPAAALIPELERAGVRVLPIRSREMVQACGFFYDAVVEQRVRVRREPDLDNAAAAAVKVSSGDAWRWGRKSTVTDVSPLVAATLALWVAGDEVPDVVDNVW